MSTTKYTKEVLEPAVRASNSVAGVLRYLKVKQAGGSQAYIARRIREFNIDTSHFTGAGWAKGTVALNQKSSEKVLRILPIGSNRAKTYQLIRAMKEEGVDYACALCYNDGTWLGKKLVLHVDHVNGDWLDNRLENVRFLCPNCHTQTETYSRKKTMPV